MAYDDGYYYGQCKIVAVVDDAADNDKTVLITTDDNKTYSGTIVNKKCEFLLPPRTLYTIQKVSSGSAEFTTKVEAGYGDCILVHLDTGYVEVKQGDIVGLDYIKAATDDKLKNKVPEAKAVKELNSSLGTLSFGQDDNGNWGYRIAGADPVIPFKSGIKLKKTCIYSQLTIDEDYDECLLVFASAGSYGSLAITNGGNYTMEDAGKSMTVNAGTVNGQANTGCFLIKNLPKGAIISATKNNSAATIWNYGFWLFA